MIAVPQEMAILIREHFNSWYGVPSLYMAKKFTYMIVTTSCTIGYTLIVYFMTDQPVEMKRIGLTLLHSVLIGLISQNVGIFFAVALDPKVQFLLKSHSPYEVVVTQHFYRYHCFSEFTPLCHIYCSVVYMFAQGTHYQYLLLYSTTLYSNTVLKASCWLLMGEISPNQKLQYLLFKNNLY